jgi:MFS superfamily sulfate permease-like transporter
MQPANLGRELSGALGDLGTLLPLALGAVVLGGLAPMPVLLGFGIAYIATALHYRLPIPVQPMKAVAAVLLTAQLTPGGVAATGVMLGLVLLLVGATGGIARFARIVPQSVVAGIQLGLGVALALLSVELMAGAPWLAGVTLALLLTFFLAPNWPGVIIALAVAIGLGQIIGTPGTAVPAGAADWPALPTWGDMEQALSVAVLPQLALTLMNAIVLTALIAQDYFGKAAAHVTPARLSMTTGLGNLVLTPFGALPMCHGAGGLAAHCRFGARTGIAPLALGLALTLLALLPAGGGFQMLALIPVPALGALLLLAAGELAFSKRLIDAKPSCWPVIAVTAGVTVWADPFWGLLAGSCSEVVRVAVVRALRRGVRY